MYYPLNYDQINLYNGTFTPSNKFAESKAFNFWCRALYQRALSVFDFDNLPETFSRDEISLMYYLFYTDGFCGSMFIDDYDEVIINPVSPKGYNVFYSPESFLLTNPALKQSTTYEYKIYHLGDKKRLGADFNPSEYGVLLNMSPDYMGIGDIIIYYAEKLADMIKARGVEAVPLDDRSDLHKVIDNSDVICISGSLYLFTDNKIDIMIQNRED